MAYAIVSFTLTMKLASVANGAYYYRDKIVEIAASGEDDAEKRTNAQTEVTQQLTTFAAITDSDIVSYNLTETVASDAAITKTGNLWREGVAVMALNITGTKKGQITIPAPIDGILAAGNKTLDPSDSALVAWFARFKSAAYARMSDGEIIRDTNPMLDSRLRSVKSGSSY